MLSIASLEDVLQGLHAIREPIELGTLSDAEPITQLKGITVSKDRVRHNAEVLTQPREVFDMLALVEESCTRAMPMFSRTYLEPACGDGNFLTEILKRKLFDAYFRAKGDPDLLVYWYPVVFSSVYGLDILEDNIESSRNRLLMVLLIFMVLAKQLNQSEMRRLSKAYIESKLSSEAFLSSSEAPFIRIGKVAGTRGPCLFDAMRFDWVCVRGRCPELKVDEHGLLDVAYYMALVAAGSAKVSSDSFLASAEACKRIVQQNIKCQSFLASDSKRGYKAECPADLAFNTYEWSPQWREGGKVMPEIQRQYVESGQVEKADQDFIQGLESDLKRM